MNRTLIVSGGVINKELINKIIKEKKFENIIAVDKGLKILDELNIIPNHIIGDFDSIDEEILKKYKNEKTHIYKLQPEKDYTDTDEAIKLAIKLKTKKITMVGTTGTRLDHTISNIQNLKIALEDNVDCKIIDNNNEITLINKTTKIKKDNNYKYISLLPLTLNVKGITLRGFKYPLCDKILEIGESIGISNEQIEDEAIIELKEGILVIIKSKD